MKLAAGAGVARLALPAGHAVAAQQVGVDSGGVGLLRVDFEAAYGAGSPWEQLFIHENVNVGVPGTTMYAEYRVDVVDHIEVQWANTTQAGGIDWATAYQTAMFLLPVDAVYRDQYWMPATPEGSTTLIAHLYESAQLNAANYNLGRVLVVFQRKDVRLNAGTMAEPIITAVTLTVAEVGQ
jgi:hypothetical protein